MPLLCDFFLEAVSGFERRDVVSRDNYRGVLADVAGCFLRSLLDDKRPKATEVHVLTMCEAVLHHCHELFDYGNNGSLVDASCL